MHVHIQAAQVVRYPDEDLGKVVQKATGQLFLAGCKQMLEVD